MKILQVINSLNSGGAEKLILETVQLYNQKNITVDVLLFWNNNHQFYNKLKALNCCKIYVLKESNNVKDIYSFSNIFKIKKIIKDYDIAHVHLFPAQYYVVFANMLNGNKTKLVLTEHSTNNRRLHIPAFKPIDKFIYNKYDKFIAITKEILDKFTSIYNLDISKAVVIENGVNLKAIQDASSYSKCEIHPSINANDKLLLQVSAFRDFKDQDTVIRSLKYLPENFKAIFVGDGNKRSASEMLANSLNLNDRVIFLGQRMDVPKILKSVDYVILSTKYEGLSLASIEGMASGKPFLASEVPGIIEIVGEAGIMFEYTNAAQLATEILKLDNDIEFTSMVINRCIKRASTYDIDNMVNAHIKLYNELYKN